MINADMLRSLYFFPPLFLVSIFSMSFVSSYLCYVHVLCDQPNMLNYL